MSTTESTLKNDEISKRIFYAGMFGLPWLWIVHSLGWYSRQRGAVDLVTSEEEDGDHESETIALSELVWVKRCRNSAVVVTFMWVVWILLIQVFLKDMFPESWFVRVPDQGEYTGW